VKQRNTYVQFRKMHSTCETWENSDSSVSMPHWSLNILLSSHRPKKWEVTRTCWKLHNYEIHKTLLGKLNEGKSDGWKKYMHGINEKPVRIIVTIDQRKRGG
jgi:hypothetical protein